VAGVAAVLLVAGGAVATYGLVVAGRRVTPTWGRALDILEVVLGLAVVPLALGACGLYALVRGLNG
ncbi:MAG: type VII secretion integral membrane protein EccD, partial [Actinocatenispora sp.]